MAPAIIYANQPKDFSLWDANKDILRQLYLTEKRPLKEVKRVMESEYGFPHNFTLSTYETTLRDHLGFRKNLKRSDWDAIATQLDKRQAKKSTVTFLGDRLTGKQVAKGVDRYHPKTKRDAAPAHVTPLRSELVIRTPSPVLPQIIPDVQSSASTPVPVPRGEHENVINNLIVTPTSEITQSPIQFPSVYHSQIGFLLQGCFSRARENLPINEFANKMIENLFASRRHLVTEDMLRSLADLVQMTGSPTTFGLNTSVEILLHASYMLSNRYTYWDRSRHFTKWIEKVADVQLLGEFFSQNTPTTIAAWHNLCFMFSPKAESYDTLAEIWFRIGAIASDDKWIQDNPSRCQHVLSEMTPARGWAVLKRISQTERTSGVQWAKHKLGLLQRLPLWIVGDPERTKDVIESGIPLPPRINLYWSDFDTFQGVRPQSLKMLVDAGVSFMPGTTGGDDTLPFWLPMFSAEKSEKWWLTQLDHFLETWDSLGSSLKDCVTVCGICAAAARGVESLREYVQGKPHQASTETSPYVPPTKKELLQVALTKTVSMGLQSIVEVLLQFGADPNMGILCDYSIGKPTVEAVAVSDVGMIRLLADHGADFDLQEVSDALIRPSRKTSEGMDPVVECEILVEALSDAGLCLQQHGPTTMLKAMGVIAIGNIYKRRVFDKYLIKALQRCGVAWDDTHFNDGKLWTKWGWDDNKIGGMDLLHGAVRKECFFDTIQFLVDEAIHIHSRPCELDGKSILHAALDRRSLDRVSVVKMLLAKMGADKKTDPVWPRLLELSIPADGPEDSDLQLFRHCKSLGAALPIATDPVKAKQRFSLIPKLIATKSQDYAIAEIWSHGAGFEKLHEEDRARLLVETIRSGSLSWACTLIEYGASINRMVEFGGSWITPFQSACLQEDTDLWLFGYLLRHGGNTTFNTTTGLTALHCAASDGNLNLTTLILENRANVNANWTPPQLPLGYTNTLYSIRLYFTNPWDLCKLSIVEGNESYTWLQPRFTPLDLASASGRLDMVKFLLNLGGQSAFPGLTGINGALKLAKRNSRHGVVMLLQQHLAARTTASESSIYGEGQGFSSTYESTN